LKLATLPLLLPGLTCSAAYGDGGDLLGCWRGERIIQYFADGTSKSGNPSDCILQFAARNIVNLCPARKDAARIAYSYQVVRAGVYSATMTIHSLRPDLVGSQREYEYKVQAEHLYIVTYPRTTKPKPPTAATRVESMSRRVACPSSSAASSSAG